MLWRILQWVQILISLIREAEDELGFGRGAEKRAKVVASAVDGLGVLSTQLQIGSCGLEVLASHVGQLVDGAVGVMNCMGVLRHGAPAIAAAATSSAGGAPPGPSSSSG